MKWSYFLSKSGSSDFHLKRRSSVEKEKTRHAFVIHEMFCYCLGKKQMQNLQLS